MTTKEIAWAAGFLEGEGSFGFERCPFISASQVQKEPLERLKSCFGGSIALTITKNPKHSNYYQWATRKRNVAGIMMTLYSFMSPKRKDLIKTALTKWRSTKLLPGLRTHCSQGHAYSIENTAHPKTGKTKRRCRICSRTQARNYYYKQRKEMI